MYTCWYPVLSSGHYTVTGITFRVSTHKSPGQQPLSSFLGAPLSEIINLSPDQIPSIKFADRSRLLIGPSTEATETLQNTNKPRKAGNSPCWGRQSLQGFRLFISFPSHHLSTPPQRFLVPDHYSGWLFEFSLPKKHLLESG